MGLMNTGPLAFPQQVMLTSSSVVSCSCHPNTFSACQNLDPFLLDPESAVRGFLRHSINTSTQQQTLAELLLCARDCSVH